MWKKGVVSYDKDTFCAKPDGLSAYRRFAHRALLLSLRQKDGREIYSADRGHRQGASCRGQRGEHTQNHEGDGADLRRRSRRRRGVRTLRAERAQKRLHEVRLAACGAGGRIFLFLHQGEVGVAARRERRAPLRQTLPETEQGGGCRQNRGGGALRHQAENARRGREQLCGRRFRRNLRREQGA